MEYLLFVWPGPGGLWTAQTLQPFATQGSGSSSTSLPTSWPWELGPVKVPRHTTARYDTPEEPSGPAERKFCVDQAGLGCLGGDLSQSLLGQPSPTPEVKEVRLEFQSGWG